MVSFLLLAAGLIHGPWDGILKKFVNPQSRVDYARLAKEGVPALDAYLAELAKPWPASMTPAEHKAAMINAYNALTVRWVLRHYPIPSIWKTKHPFTEARHTLNGRALSLDQLETQLRDMDDPRVHSVLVCAAQSCPPLRREAYVAEKLDAQLDDNTRAWLANTKLNEFDAKKREAEVSNIFEWYRGDFEKNGATLGGFLAKYGPPQASFVSASGVKIQFRKYKWGLNDSGGAGDSYGGLSFYFDYLRNK